jgi:sec-independent protein translocase protein TatA
VQARNFEGIDLAIPRPEDHGEVPSLRPGGEELGELSIWHWLIVLIVVLLLFGSGKLSTLMGDFAKGIKAFRKTMESDEAHTPPPAAVPPPAIGSEPGIEMGAEAEKTPVHHEG